MAEIAQKQIDLGESQDPETRLIVDYWNEKRGRRLAPAWTDIELFDLPLSLIPNIVIVDVIDDGQDFQYRFWGTWHVQFHGYDQTGKRVSELNPPIYSDLIADQYRQTITAREPQLFVQQIPLKSGLWVFTELSRFPLSSDGKNITHILSAELAFEDTSEVWKYFADSA